MTVALPRELLPLIIRGCPFTLRTFMDGTWGTGRSLREAYTIDRLVTVTLPFIEGYFGLRPTMEVRLYSKSTAARALDGGRRAIDPRRTRHRKTEGFACV